MLNRNWKEKNQYLTRQLPRNREGSIQENEEQKYRNNCMLYTLGHCLETWPFRLFYQFKAMYGYLYVDLIIFSEATFSSAGDFPQGEWIRLAQLIWFICRLFKPILTNYKRSLSDSYPDNRCCGWLSRFCTTPEQFEKSAQRDHTHVSTQTYNSNNVTIMFLPVIHGILLNRVIVWS